MAIKPIQILINAKDNASSVFSSLQAKVATVGAAIATYFGVSAFSSVVKGAAEFEAGMSRVQAATGASAKEMQVLTQAAQDAGANTKYTSTEAAGALETLGKAGLSAADAVATLPAVLNLAQAGDIGLAQASEFVTKAVAGMGLAFTDAARVADVLALGANATNTSVEGLAQALSYAAPIAQSAGVSLEGTVAIMGKLADAGIDASRSGTAVSNMMAQFQDPASQFKTALADAGITTNNFELALHQLAAAGPKGEKAILAVGLNAGPALRALLNQGMPALDELKKKLESAAGSAAATAKVMQDNLAGSFKGLTSAWDTVKNVLGTPVLPVLKDGVDQLAGAFRAAVADGTVQKFGESIATAFQAGIKWVRDFVGTVDFSAVLTRLQEFADTANQRFTEFGQYATNAGNIVQTAYGVMSAGVNAVLTGIYGLGSAFTEMAAIVMQGVAQLREGLASVTFGALSESFKLAAEDARSMAQGFSEAAQAMRDKASAAFVGMADSAQTARNGFAGLTGEITQTGQAAGTTSKAIADMAAQIEAVGQKTATAKKATEDKAAADIAARQAIKDLREEYAALVEKGDLQAAAQKIIEINKALAGTGPAAKDAAKAAQDAAAQIDAAFQRLGVTSSAALKDQAANARRDYETIKTAGTSSAQDIANAFKVAADRAIAANNGIAPSWVTAQAAANKYTVEVDAAGKATLKAGADAEKGTAAAAAGWHGTTAAVREATQAVAEYQQRVLQKYGKPGQGDKPEDLAPGVKKMGGTYSNKDGMTSDAKGNVQQQWLWTRAAIIDYLQSAGLDQTLAEDLAKQFVKSDGSVDYIAGSAQKKWGGKYGTLSEALGKMVDYYKYDPKGKAEAANRSGYLSGGKPPANPGPPPAPGPTPGRNSSFGNTYVSNITIPGLGTTSISFSDARSQSDAEEIMRRIAQARGAAQ